MKKIAQINIILNEYFEHNKNVQEVPVAFMMSYFVLAGIFKDDHSKGKNLKNFLRRLEDKKQLHLIPFAKVEQKNILKKWFFVRAHYKPLAEKSKAQLKKSPKYSFKKSDAAYILSLCNKVLISKYQVSKKDFTITAPSNLIDLQKMKVDGYYPDLKIAIKFLEKSNPSKVKSKLLFFTEKTVFEQIDYQIIFISYKKFAYLASGKLNRRTLVDLEVLREVLEPFYPKTTLF